MSITRRYTSADLEALPRAEGTRYEIIDDRDVLTSPLLPGFACPVASLWAPTL